MSTQVHTVNFLQKVFGSKVNQIFPLDVVKIINNDRIEMENKMYNKKYNIINMINKYDRFFDETIISICEDMVFINKGINYEEIVENLDSDFVSYCVNELKFKVENYEVEDRFYSFIELIQLFDNILEKNDIYAKLLEDYENIESLIKKNY